MKYSYKTAISHTSFDYGEVEAETTEEAREKAINQLNYDFEKVNAALNTLDNTKGFSIHFNPSDVTLTHI